MVHILTIDVEEYFHSTSFMTVLKIKDWPHMESRVEHATRRVLDLLAAHHVQATFFVLGYVAKHHPRLIREIQRAGHEIGCHGMMHQPIYMQSQAAFRADVQSAKNIIEDTIGQQIIGYRAPAYSVTPRSLWALRILCEIGFQYDSSIFPVYHDRYGIPAAPRAPFRLPGLGGGCLFEFPIATARLCGINLPLGGGYLRIAPYRYTRWALRRVSKKDSTPAVLYFHPWELDPWQPKIRCGWRSKFRHYTGLRTMEHRVTRLLSDFPFTMLRNYYAQIVAQSREIVA